MYQLGEQFEIDYTKGKANESSIIVGGKYRFTILTERLIRLEYSEHGIFNDEPTQLVWNRLFDVPKFDIRQDERYLEITTTYFKITYVKEQKFSGTKISPMANLKVELLNTDRVWYYGHPEVRNFGSPAYLLSDHKGKTKFGQGLYSLDGFASFDDSKDYIMKPGGIIVPNENDHIDLYLFMYLNDFHLCLQDYFALTGYPALLPRYALGNWWSKNEAYNDASLKNVVDNFEKNEIPLSVILLDKDWHLRTYLGKEHLKTGFTFNKEYFKAPFEMISYLHSKGIRVGLNINPTEGFYDIDEYYEKAKGYLTPDDSGVIPFQILNPKWIDVYLKLFIHPLDALGVDFYWIDHFNRSKLEEMQLLKHYHIYDMKRNYKRRPMILGYNSAIAPHRYPVLYSGKTIVGWDALKMIPMHNAAASNIGVSWWSHDIGGYFKGIEDNELYIRYVQLGVFSPILKFGADSGKYYKREPWRWSVKTSTIAKDYLNLRHKMIPYLYSEAYKYHKFGVPVVQPVYYKYPELYDDVLFRNEYYFGSELFVSPIVSKKDYVMDRVIHKFYIPDGIWYDFVTGKKFPGGREYVSFFRDQDYPVFAKAGSIIPFGYNDNLNDTTPPNNIEIQIFPGQSNVYKLYEDDGVSDLYRKGFYLLSSIDYNYLRNNYTVIVRALDGKSGIVPEHRNYKVIFRNTKKADVVLAYQDTEPISSISYVDGADFIVEVEDVKTISQLTINCKGKDIEIDAVRLINQDIEQIISDLQIETLMKEKIDTILFSDLPIKKKRIEIRKLASKGLERKFIKLFLKLLEYLDQV